MQNFFIFFFSNFKRCASLSDPWWPVIKQEKGFFFFYLFLSFYDDKFYFQFGGQEERKKFKRERVQKKKWRRRNCRRALQVEREFSSVLVEYIDWRTGRPGKKKNNFLRNRRENAHTTLRGDGWRGVIYFYNG